MIREIMDGWSIDRDNSGIMGVFIAGCEAADAPAV
jgi:hypothetical protein